MQRIFFTACFLLTALIALGQNTYYVGAPSGLKLRKTPSATGETIKTLPLGTKVSATKDVKPKVTHKVEEIKGFSISGFWQQVTAGAETGYVFSGYLLPFSPLTSTELHNFWNDTTQLPCMPSEWLFLESRGIKPFGTMFDIEKYGEDSIYYKTLGPSPYCEKTYSQKFDNGNIILTVHNYSESSAGSTLKFKNLTMAQVYLIARGSHDLKDDVITYTNNQIIIGPKDDGAGCYTTIAIENGWVVWDFYCSC